MTDFLTPSTQLPPYLMFPRFLLDVSLSETAKLVYMILLDRARISQGNGRWTDEQGRVFLCYPIHDLAAALRKSETTVKTALSALEKAGLIERKRQGTGHANRIYIRLLTDRNPSVTQAENCPHDRRKTAAVTGRKLSTNKNYRERTIEKEQRRSYDCREEDSL